MWKKFCFGADSDSILSDTDRTLCGSPPEKKSEQSTNLTEKIPGARKEVKVLLLGAGDSGKSTFLKQMQYKFRSSSEFGEESRFLYSDDIRKSIVSSMWDILDATYGSGQQLNPETILDRYSYIRDRNALWTDICTSMESNSVRPDLMIRIWSDPAIQRVVAQANTFQYMDTMPYFMDEIERIASPEYVPTFQDILMYQCRTTGIEQQRFKFPDVTYNVCDTGGQRSERKKWRYCYKDAGVVLFFVSLSEYDECLAEDHSVNRMQESLRLFSDVIRSEPLRNATIVLVFSKVDQLDDKLAKSPLEDYFPSYAGGKDVDNAQNFLVKQFLSLVPSHCEHVYAKVLNVTDVYHSLITLLRDITEDDLGREK